MTCKLTNSQVWEIRTWTFVGSCYATYQAVLIWVVFSFFFELFKIFAISVTKIIASPFFSFHMLWISGLGQVKVRDFCVEHNLKIFVSSLEVIALWKITHIFTLNLQDFIIHYCIIKWKVRYMNGLEFDHKSESFTWKIHYLLNV